MKLYLSQWCMHIPQYCNEYFDFPVSRVALLFPKAEVCTMQALALWQALKQAFVLYRRLQIF